MIPNKAIPAICLILGFGFTPLHSHGADRKAATAATIVEQKLHTAPMELIPLLRGEYLALVGGSAGPVNGIYRVETSTNWLYEDKVAGGHPERIAVLKDKTGGEHALMALQYVMTQGNAGQTYVLMTIRESRRQRSLVYIRHLGYEDASDHDDWCKGRAKGWYETGARVYVEDSNHDGADDITIYLGESHCPSHDSRSPVIRLVAADGGFRNDKLLEDEKNFTANLLREHRAAIALYRKDKVSNRHVAAGRLERAGILDILDYQPPSLSRAQYVQLLNDYAFLQGASDITVEILDRVIDLAPDRKVAWLNRAEHQMNLANHRSLPSTKLMQAATSDAVDDYIRYLQLGGSRQEALEKFAIQNLIEIPNPVGPAPVKKPEK